MKIMIKNIGFTVSLTPYAQEEIEDKLRDFLDGLGIAMRIDNTETGNTTMAGNVEGGYEDPMKVSITERIVSEIVDAQINCKYL